MVLLFIFSISIFLSSAYSETLKLSIFDTGYCLNKLPKYSSKIKIHQVYDTTQSINKTKMQNLCRKIDLKRKRYHGQNVLITLLENLKPKGRIEIFPIIIFDNNHIQTQDYWNKAIVFSKKNKINFSLLATGLVTNRVDKSPFPIPSFMATPKVGRGIKHTSNIWPQTSISKKILIGHYQFYNGNYFYDNSLLYNKRIDYYFPESSNENSIFKGTSYSVAFSMNKAIKICETSFYFGVTQVKKCLSRNRITFHFDSIKDSNYTY